MALLTSEEKELLTRAANLMEELLETIEVAQDKQLAKDLKAALKEAESGKTRPIEELVRELGLEDEIRSQIHSQIFEKYQSLRQGCTSSDNSRN